MRGGKVIDKGWGGARSVLFGTCASRLRTASGSISCGSVSSAAKPSCHCASRLRHGPYTFLRYQSWDGAAGRDRYAREYVPRSELTRVRRWIRRARAETALGWGQAGLLRRLLVARV